MASAFASSTAVRSWGGGGLSLRSSVRAAAGCGQRLRVTCKVSMAHSSSNLVKVAVGQMTSSSDIHANFQTCARLVQEAVAAGAKLLSLPEGFSYIGSKEGESVRIAEPLDGPIMTRYQNLAREAGLWLSLGGFQEKGPDPGHLYNTHVILDDTGTIRAAYRKIHLFDVDVPGGPVWQESTSTASGSDVIVVASPLGMLGLTVCYDLRFPQLYQNLRFKRDAQVLFVPAAFTKKTGEAHWECLLRARAIETQCYVVAAAQAGRHNEIRESYGDALIIDPWGTVIGRCPDKVSTGIAVAELDLSLVQSVRQTMPIVSHRRYDLYGESAEGVYTEEPNFGTMAREVKLSSL